MPESPSSSGFRSQVSGLGSKQLEHFRSDRKRLPLHPLEKAVLWVVALHLCFLPWALGTMHVWSQVTSLGLSAVGLALALIPRNYSGDLAPQLSGVFASVWRSENRGQSPRRRPVDDPRDASTHQQGTPGWQQPATASSRLPGLSGRPSGLRFQVSGSTRCRGSCISPSSGSASRSSATSRCKPPIPPGCGNAAPPNGGCAGWTTSRGCPPPSTPPSSASTSGGSSSSTPPRG